MGKKDAALSRADAPENACILYRELLRTEREGTLFVIASRSGAYERAAAFPEAYVRELIARLTDLLGELDAERSDGKVVRLKK